MTTYTTYDNGTTEESVEVREAREAAEARARMIAGLRELAQLLEEHPDLPAPYVYANAYADSADEARRGRRGIAGWEKRTSRDSYYTTYEKRTGPVSYRLSVSKGDTCRRVQVGTRHVPAVEAHDEPVYEWDCSGQ